MCTLSLAPPMPVHPFLATARSQHDEDFDDLDLTELLIHLELDDEDWDEEDDEGDEEVNDDEEDDDDEGGDEDEDEE